MSKSFMTIKFLELYKFKKSMYRYVNADKITILVIKSYGILSSAKEFFFAVSLKYYSLQLSVAVFAN